MFRRRPRGIDNRVRRRFKGNKLMAKCGYGSDKKTKYLLPNGLKPFTISNIGDLEILLMNNRTYAGVISHSLSAVKKAAIVRRAAELNVNIINKKGKLKAEEKKVEAKVLP